MKRVFYKAVVLPLFAFAGGAAATMIGGGQAEATSRSDSPYAAVGQLARVLVEIENNYVEPVDRGKLLTGAVKGMVAELDPHSSFMPPQDFTAFESDTEGKFGGVGVEVETRGDAIIVLSPIEGSPAERAGVRAGDRILAVDGTDVSAQPLDKLVTRMRGNPGTHVKLVLRREGVTQPLVVDLVREVIHVPSVGAKMLAGGVAYVRVKQFQEHTHDELVAAAARLRKQSPKLAGVIFDLRNNPGGLVDEASETADEFLSSGTIYTTRHRGEILDDVRAKSGGAFADVPVVALVNEYSASASELVAGALQDQKRATIVGARTFGKGSVQAIIGLPGGSGLRLTIARYYTPSGHAIQADGVHPDVAVDGPHVAGIPVQREEDLEGALAAERAGASAGGATGAGAGAVVSAGGDAGTVADSELRSDARNVGADPRRGNDAALKTAYEILIKR